ncbi:MAG: ABC transporter ATP-binding protein [Candidatus Methanoperedens sp.]
MTIIELKNITKRYNNTPAVENLSFTVEEGEIFAILGPSGCGKTTTLRLIAGFDMPDDGELVLAGKTVADKGVFVPAEKRKVGMVFQDYALFPHITVRENIAFGLKNLDDKEKDAIVENMLQFVGLSGLEERHPFHLSGGQQQRVALARALAPCPVTVLLDEPFSNLDADMRTQMREEMIKILRKSGTTAILVTHDQEEAFAMADRVAVMNNGRMEQLGTPEEVYHYPTTGFVADFVGKADFIDGTIEADGIRTEIGLFPNNTRLEIGEKVQVMIRPDDIEIEPAGTGCAVIKDQQFKGSEVLYTLELPREKYIHSALPSTRTLPAGTRVDVKARPVHLVAFQNGKAVSEKS